MKLTDRFQHAWNAFVNNKDPTDYTYTGYTYSYRPDRPKFTRGNERSIVNAIYSRIAVDAASISIQHVRLDENGRYSETINSHLNDALTLEANLDQSGRAFIQDAVMSMLDEGSVAIVPTVTTLNPMLTGSYDIVSLRTGRIKQWYPDRVRVEVYNEKVGKKEEIILPKKLVCIVENPFYSVMNEPNSVLQRLIRKLNLLDAIDEQSGAGKLDLIIQLPYTIKSEARKQQADLRRKEMEAQLEGSKYGVAYTDGTEKITQLNRPLENNLLAQIQYLTDLLYSQLGMTVEVLNGTADERTMLNYTNKTLEPILSVIVDEMKRKFLTKTARSQGQSIMIFREPFKLVPVDNLADIADRFTRNEILSSNEVRGLIGFKPSQDPKADELRNKNINQDSAEAAAGMQSDNPEDEQFLQQIEQMSDEEIANLSDEEREEMVRRLDEIQQRNSGQQPQNGIPQ